jgi:transcriptional regulator with XRE-family HTH domain
MDTKELVQKRIIELCLGKRWSFNALATYSGIPHGTMKSIISGKSNNPGIVTIKKICDGLEISLAEFFNTSDFASREQEIK